jgi:hypothetical protein
MKFLKYLQLLTVAIIMVSCGNDDSEDVKKNDDPNDIYFSFSDREYLIEIPEGLKDKQDPYASIARSYISLANSIVSYNQYFEYPAGTAVSHDRIVGENARMQSGKYSVYIWGDPQIGKTAYQLGDHDGYYTFEIFIQNAGENKWLSLVTGEERKDQSRGHMIIRDIYSNDPSTIDIRFDWSRLGDIFKFQYLTDQTKMEIEVNEKTKIGGLVFFNDNIKVMEINWIATGAGTWRSFDSEGKLEDEGFWE